MVVVAAETSNSTSTSILPATAVVAAVPAAWLFMLVMMIRMKMVIRDVYMANAVPVPAYPAPVT